MQGGGSGGQLEQEAFFSLLVGGCGRSGLLPGPWVSLLPPVPQLGYVVDTVGRDRTVLGAELHEPLGCATERSGGPALGSCWLREQPSGPGFCLPAGAGLGGKALLRSGWLPAVTRALQGQARAGRCVSRGSDSCAACVQTQPAAGRGAACAQALPGGLGLAAAARPWVTAWGAVYLASKLLRGLHPNPPACGPLPSHPAFPPCPPAGSGQGPGGLGAAPSPPAPGRSPLPFPSPGAGRGGAAGRAVPA